MSSANGSTILDDFRKLPDFSAFEVFAQALWKDEAAVMVGAGFSRVCTREPNSPIPPLWGNFKTTMEEALGYEQGKGPDALRLAQEYQTLHGDNGLDQLISRLITDDQWEPGSLHKQLLELPWRDILTTNWDTLLERTKPQTPDRIYSCVRTVQDIAHQARPRIVKLHGSLPSNKPYIFTEDDYRTYPVKFAPFVNLAQQVMLEHDLCLIGFSGVDPNFLAWSGWVRDTLNVSARRIRLVGVLNLSPVSRTLLERRNVTPIDLAPLVSALHRDEQHEKALELFFEALTASKPRSPFEWNITFDRFSDSLSAKEEEKPSRANVATAWSNDRRAYPGWIVGPFSQTHLLRYGFPSLRKADEQPEAHLRFAMERIWRHRTAGIWLNPQDVQDADIHFEDAEKLLSKQERILICSSIAAEWRRYQKWEDWKRWMSRLEKIGSQDAVFYHAYETGQRALLDWDDDAVLKASVELKSDQPIWMMRRAGLLATLFRHREAAELYEAALLSIRQKLLSAPKSAWLISLEGWAAMFHQASFSALNDDFFTFPAGDSDETRMRYHGAKADPWEEITRLERLASERIDRNRADAEQWKLSFKSGQYSPSGTAREGDNDCPFYGLLEIIERTGAPEHIANVNAFSTRLETAYRAITKHDENDLLAFFARYRGTEKKILDWVIPRMQLAQLSNSTVEHFLSVIPQRIDRLAALQDRRGGEGHLAFLLELLARVVVRASSQRALEVFEWTANLLGSASLGWNCYATCGAVLEGAVETMEANEQEKAIELALKMKLPGEARARGAKEKWPEIVSVFSEEHAQKFQVSPRCADRINSLIELVRKGDELDRGRAIRRLHFLHNIKKLREAQIEALEEAIWTRCGETGWPRDTQLHPWIFLELPGKAHAEALFQERIVNGVANGHIDHEILLNLRAGLERTEANVEKRTLVACVESCLNWKPAATENLNPIARALSGNDRRNQTTANEIGEVLARSLLPRLEAEDLPECVAKQLLAPEKLPHIPSLAATTAFQVSRIWPNHLPRAFTQIRAALASRDPNRVYPAFIAMMQFIKDASPTKVVPREIRELLLHACEQRTQPGLSSTLQLLAQMVNDGYLADDEMDRLATALPDILEEYRYDQRNLEVPSMAELPNVRKGVHRLSEMLSEYCSDLEKLKEQLVNDPLPEVRFLN